MPAKKTFAAMIRERAEVFPARAILTFVEVVDDRFRDEVRTYRDLIDRGSLLASWLAQRGVRKGDRFAIMMENHPEFVEAMVAASLLGAVFVPVDARSRGDKLRYLLEFSECRGVVAGCYAVPALSEVASGSPHWKWTLVVGDAMAAQTADIPAPLSYAAALADPPTEFPTGDPHAPFFMMFTSGTTGNPKAVVQTQAAYLAAASGRPFGIRSDDTLYTGLSLTHINAQGTLRTGLFENVPVIISRKFTKSRLWAICRAYGCTMFNLLGGMIPEVFGVPEKPNDADNPVRQINSAGMPVALWDAYRRRFGVEILELYGATEGGGALINPPGVGPVGSMGKPLPPFVAGVFDADNRPCPPQTAGELRFRRSDRDALPVDYFRNRDAGEKKIVNGWFCTGDIVHQDEEGWFYFHHRAGGGVRRNGDFVNTALVEAVMARSPLVSDVFVYGVPTSRNVAGEKTLVAAIVPAQPMSFETESLLEFCRANLEKNDVPEIVQVLAQIPKTASEKPIERDCIALLEGEDRKPA